MVSLVPWSMRGFRQAVKSIPGLGSGTPIMVLVHVEEERNRVRELSPVPERERESHMETVDVAWR